MGPAIDGGERLDRRLAGAKGVADTVCYEGYVLYPYRASAKKNQFRWQFGVLAPPSVAAGGAEPASATAEIIVEARSGACLGVRLRALRAQRRTIEALDSHGDFCPVASLDDGEAVWTSFDEAVEVTVDLDGIDLDGIEDCTDLDGTDLRPAGTDLDGTDLRPAGTDLDGTDLRPAGTDLDGTDLRPAGTVPAVVDIDLPGSETAETITGAGGIRLGRAVRQVWPVTGRLRVAAQPVDGPYPLVRVSLSVDNTTDWPAGAGSAQVPSRDEAMRRSLLATHLLVAVERGRVISSLDPPRFAAAAVASCRNAGLFPVLVGNGDDDDVVLASPIILYDHPALAPESDGDMFDATEIDEILALRVQTLTDAEKREARGTDPRSAAIIDRCDAMGPEALGALHGTFRSVRPVGNPGSFGAGAFDEAWWEPEVDSRFDPWADTVEVLGVAVGKGSRVRLRPQRRSDAQDLFVDGRAATVAGVFHDVSGDVYLAVAVDDPDADLHQWHGRYLYFHPDEVQLLDEPSGLHLPAPADPADPGAPAPASVLVAGVGNIFFGDDGFGVEVARHLLAGSLPAGAKVEDFGIRGVHLAYELLGGYQTLVLVDAVSRGDPPGTVSVIEHDAAGDGGGTLAAVDAHGMDPLAVLAMAADLGAGVGRVLVVACETADVTEGIGLSAPVAEAVPRAAAAVVDLLATLIPPAVAPPPSTTQPTPAHPSSNLQEASP
ncbi:MAG: hydrogenase maturation protease [Acidimicrobiales bacterium]